MPVSAMIHEKSIAPPPPDDLGDAGVAVTVTDWAADPPRPVQVKVKVSVAVTAIAKVPLFASLPLQPVPPLAMQAVALWLLQVSVTVPPAATDEALAVNVTVGGAEATCSEYNP